MKEVLSEKVESRKEAREKGRRKKKGRQGGKKKRRKEEESKKVERTGNFVCLFFF